MQMDSELASMKEECDKKIEQARSEGGAYTAANTEDDEQKIELLLRTGTLTFQIRDLKRDVKRLTKELEVAQQREKDLSEEVETYCQKNEELFAQNEKLSNEIVELSNKAVSTSPDI